MSLEDTEIVFYYPLRDRLAVDLFRDALIASFPGLGVNPLVDHLTDDHPLPHFSMMCTKADYPQLIETLQTQCSQFSIRIKTEPERWLGRNLFRRN